MAICRFAGTASWVVLCGCCRLLCGYCRLVKSWCSLPPAHVLCAVIADLSCETIARGSKLVRASALRDTPHATLRKLTGFDGTACPRLILHPFHVTRAARVLHAPLTRRTVAGRLPACCSQGLTVGETVLYAAASRPRTGPNPRTAANPRGMRGGGADLAGVKRASAFARVCALLTPSSFSHPLPPKAPINVAQPRHQVAEYRRRRS